MVVVRGDNSGMLAKLACGHGSHRDLDWGFCAVCRQALGPDDGRGLTEFLRRFVYFCGLACCGFAHAPVVALASTPILICEGRRALCEESATRECRALPRRSMWPLPQSRP
mmetsp:Transcript_39068/g.112871  ORF Transcript_39068/g.112871 Transcript_39068/m.112871 type:complete len:111 (+) Transcript_39068:535-867(+)